MASITITHEMFAAMSEGARAEIVKMLAVPPVAVAVAAAAAAEPDEVAPTPMKKRGRPSKKGVEPKATDPNAPPKEKRAPNSWILFSGRVEKLIRSAELEKGADKDTKMRTVVVKQFASFLKKIKADAEWTDEAILAALESWTPPAATEAPATVAEPVAAAEPAEPAPAEPAAKKRGPKKLSEMTAEERAAHDAKIAERKAKKSAEAPAAEKAKME